MEITNNLYVWLQDNVFCNMPFNKKEHKWSGALRAQNYSERYVMIQAGNSFGLELHYEYYQSRWEFHVEIEDKGSRELFIKWIKERIPNNEWFAWENWQKDSCRYQCREDIDSYENLTAVFYQLFGTVEPHIKSYEKKCVHIESTGKVENEGALQNECVEFNAEFLSQIFERKLNIPPYQRIYCWEKDNVLQLLNDISAIKTSAYNMGNIILHKRGEVYDIVDGQQRLVTLSILHYVLDENKNRATNSLLKNRPTRPTLLDSSYKSNSALQQIYENYKHIQVFLNQRYGTTNQESLDSFITNLKKLKFGVLVIEQNYLDLAFTFFSNTNSKGKKLSDYDLLKPHHLRNIPSDFPEQQQMYAQQWDDMLAKEQEKTDSSDKSTRREADYVRVLELYLYRLRKWSRGQFCSEGANRVVYQEYKTADFIDEIPPFGEQFDFFEHIQGGQHFFEFVNHFRSQFDDFKGKEDGIDNPYQIIHRHLGGYSDRWYAYVMEALLFCYYNKFGKAYLNEAALSIVRYVSQIRFEKAKAYEPTIVDFARNSGIIPSVIQSSSPTFFLAELERKIAAFPPIDISQGNIRKWFLNSCKTISDKLEKNCNTNHFKDYFHSHYGNITSK